MQNHDFVARPCRLFAVFLTMQVFTLFAAANQEFPPWRLKPKIWKLSTQTSYFTTDANYAQQRGTYADLSGDNSLTLLEQRTRARYNFNRRVSVFGGFDFTKVDTRSADFDRSNTNVSGVRLGLNYDLGQKWVRWIAEVEGFFSTDPIDVDTQEALTNDGVASVRAEMFAFRPFRWAYVFAHAGLLYRDEGLATLGLWGIGFEKPFSDRYLVGAGLDGYETVIGDELRLSDRQQIIERVNGGSFRFYSYDPALIEARAWVGWNPSDPWQLRFGGGHTLNGVRSAAGLNLFLSLAYSFDPKPDRESFQYFRSVRPEIRRKNRRALEDFKVDEEPPERDLFDQNEGFEPDP